MRSGVRSLGHIVALFLVFWGTSVLFSTVAAPTPIPTNRIRGFPFNRKYFLCISKFNCKSNLSTLLHRQKSRFLQRTTSHGIFSREVLRQKFCSHCTRSREESMSHNYFSLEPETAKICKRGEILLESKIGKKKKRVHFQKSRTSNNATLKHCKTVTDRATAHPLANGTLFFRKGFGDRPKTVTVRTRPWAVNVRRPYKPKCL